MFDRAEAIDKAFRERVTNGDLPEPVSDLTYEHAGLSAPDLIDLYETQVMSRQLDLMARRSKGRTFYSIGSSGHEGTAAIAKAARVSDMAFLHYRDAAFLTQRRRDKGGTSVLYDMMLSFAASSDDPVSGGRHKVLGGKDVFVPPQTSTIASHLPKAVGTAHAVALARKLQLEEAVLPHDAVVICSFGDASANHSTAQGAINSAAWAAFQNAPMPIVFVCEDNDIGISVRTPQGWIKACYENRPGLKYMACNGLSLADTYATASNSFTYARSLRKPVFLHVKTVRLMGHAGADIEASYSDVAKIEAVEAQDPLLQTAAELRRHDHLSTEEIIRIYDETAQRVKRVAEEAFLRPKLETASAVMESLIPEQDQTRQQKPASTQQRKAMWGKEATAHAKPQPMARHINNALADLMLDYPQTLVFGEDVGRKGGVYSVTTGLQKKFGPARVMDTLLDEQTILGLAIGTAHNGFLPIPEIQFLAYVHNAEDQIRGEAATLSFFSNGQYTNPMVIRIAGLGYQKGFGGHFHNDNSLTIFRDIPGVIVACPSNGPDAAKMLRESVRLAHEEQRVVVFVEPIALYMTADLHEEGDKAWLAPYDSPQNSDAIGFGEPNVHGRGTDLCILTYGNGYYLSRKAAQLLTDKHDLKVRVVDLRWLHPLNEAAILKQARACKHTLIVDECRETGSLSEQLMAILIEKKYARPVARVTAEDSFIPLGKAATVTLPDVNSIVKAARSLTKGTGK
ncbi:MAG: thiamine pyrophosphate-dependent enzyme [Aquisalinus sp.]|nr:thiamine pyrophosphate-dependent enzyme [Aquisalinus sp.]